MAAQIANNTNRSLSLLTGVTTLLLPPTFITGLFGMNVKRLPFTDDEFGFIYAVAMCALSSLAMYIDSAPHGHLAVTRRGAGTAITVTPYSAHPRRLYHRNPSSLPPQIPPRFKRAYVAPDREV